MMGLIVVLSALYVYYDATKHRIGKIAGEAGFANLHAGGWAICTLLLWIVAFPLYLFKRKALIAKASDHPIDARHRTVILVLLSLVAAFVLLSILLPK
jgi:hypothetical protein